MSQAIDLLSALRAYLLVLLVLGFAPGALLRIVVRLYPKGHPRRRELLAELYALPYALRPLFVVQQLETAAFEGIPARWNTSAYVRHLFYSLLVPATVGIITWGIWYGRSDHTIDEPRVYQQLPLTTTLARTDPESISLSYEPIPGVDGYRVLRDPDADGGVAVDTGLLDGASSVDISDPHNDIEHCYVVFALVAQDSSTPGRLTEPDVIVPGCVR